MFNIALYCRSRFQTGSELPRLAHPKILKKLFLISDAFSPAHPGPILLRIPLLNYHNCLRHIQFTITLEYSTTSRLHSYPSSQLNPPPTQQDSFLHKSFIFVQSTRSHCIMIHRWEFRSIIEGTCNAHQDSATTNSSFRMMDERKWVLYKSRQNTIPITNVGSVPHIYSLLHSWKSFR